jgi:DNA-binding transcriptional MerR regulator
MATLTIGEVAQRTRVKVPTIRYYEHIGLLRPPHRSESNRRHYRDIEVRRIAFIRSARELGFEIKDIRTLIALQDDPEQSCNDIDAIARQHLVAIDDKIAHLTALRIEVKRVLDCCSGGRVASCRVIEAIATLGEAPTT